MFETYITSKIGEFIWDGFTDPAGVGVRLVDILDGARLVGVDLTDAQKDSVLAHIDEPDKWDESDENVRDLIADATDNANYNQMFAWLAFVVGNQTAAGLVREWEEEARAALDRAGLECLD